MQEARDFLQQQDLMSLVIKDLSSLGHVGEQENKLIVYLAAISRKLDNPLGVVVQGPSSAGKTELVNTIARLCPKEDVFYATRVTPQAFFYLGLEDPYLLAHKLVLIEESKGAEEANYAIRILLSQKRLELLTVLNKAATKIVLHGPVAYLETTTAEITNDETANRVLQVNLDSSEEQTQAVLKAQRERASRVVVAKDKEIVERHQMAQRLLQPKQVVIPFTEQITFHTHLTRARRDHKRLLDLTCAVAFLHQYQRRQGSIDSVEYVEAVLEDYEIASHLVQKCLANVFSALSPEAKELLEQVHRMIGEAKEKTLTRWDICRRTGLSLRQVRNHIRDLVDLGYLRVVSGSQGKEYVYQLSDQRPTPSWNHQSHNGKVNDLLTHP
jgi:energy-coupling factor transporter ATP-binding protein EcfA2